MLSHPAALWLRPACPLCPVTPRFCSMPSTPPGRHLCHGPVVVGVPAVSSTTSASASSSRTMPWRPPSTRMSLSESCNVACATLASLHKLASQLILGVHSRDVCVVNGCTSFTPVHCATRSLSMGIRLSSLVHFMERRPAHSHRRVRSAGGRSKALPTFTSGE